MRIRGQESPSAGREKGDTTRGEPRRRRRGIGDVVTEDRIQQTADSLNQLFLALAHSVPPAADEAEEQRRRAALQRGAQRVLLGALAYLKEHKPAVARALVRAGQDWAEKALRGEEPRFVVRLSAAPPAPLWMMNPALIGMHRHIVAGLKAAWSAPLKTDPLLSERFVSHKGRFGEAQLKGTRLRDKRVKQRVAAVIEMYDSIAKESGIGPAISEATARRWVMQDKTPARISLRILGLLLGKTPRTIKKMLDQAGRYMREADEQHGILNLWGFTRVGAESVKPTDSGTPSQGGRVSEP